MSDDKRVDESIRPSLLSRRDFTALSVAASVAAVAGLRTAEGAVPVTDTDVEIKTPNGTCDAALVHPTSKGTWPAAILFPDAFGLRPTMRAMAKRLAEDGYTVLVPNPYYRMTKAPGIDSNFNFASTDDRAKLAALRAPLTNDGVASDVSTYIAFLDSQSVVNKKAKLGVFGYCMGGTMTMQSAAAAPQRIGAAASFHGGGLVTDKPESPHLLVPKMKGEFYIGIASNDDEKQPDAKTKLKEAFAAAHLSARVEVYDGALHGWCVKDMPVMEGKTIYNEPQAERAWGELSRLFKRALV